MSSPDRMRASVKVPVTTAEQWHVWQEHPELGKHVDLIAAHVLPYWESVSVENSVPLCWSALKS